MSTSTTVNKPAASSLVPAQSSSSNVHQVDPSFLGYGGGDQDLPIDPALFAIEQVVNDVRKGKIKPELQDATQQSRVTGQGHGHGHETISPSTTLAAIAAATAPSHHLGGTETGGIDMLDEEFDPALREIVNSLTNAQQVCPPSATDYAVRAT